MHCPALLEELLRELSEGETAAAPAWISWALCEDWHFLWERAETEQAKV